MFIIVANHGKTKTSDSAEKYYTLLLSAHSGLRDLPGSGILFILFFFWSYWLVGGDFVPGDLTFGTKIALEQIRFKG